MAMRAMFAHAGKEVTHWFPGHMAAGFRAMQKNLRRCDAVLEVHDARIPFVGRNPNFKYLCEKPRILILTKVDLAHPSCHQSKDIILNEHLPNGKRAYSDVVFVASGKYNQNIKKILPVIIDSLEQDLLQQRNHLRLLIVGMPNVGKSSLVNSMRAVYSNKRKCARTGDRPGVTRTVQPDIKIHDNPPIYVLDTPGVMIPNISNLEHAMMLATLGTMRDELVGEEHIADYLLYTLNRLEMFSYVERYKLDEPCDDIQNVLQSVAKCRGALLKGGHPDILRAANSFLADFRHGHLGKFYLNLSASQMPTSYFPNKDNSYSQTIHESYQ